MSTVQVENMHRIELKSVILQSFLGAFSQTPYKGMLCPVEDLATLAHSIIGAVSQPCSNILVNDI